MPFCARLRAVSVGNRPGVAVEQIFSVHWRGMHGLKGFDRASEIPCVILVIGRFLVVPLDVYPQVRIISFVFRPNGYANEDFPRFTHLSAFANRPWPGQKLLRLGGHCDMGLSLRS